MKATIAEELVLHAGCPRCGSHEKFPLLNIAPGAALGPWCCSRCGGGIEGRITEDGSAEIEAVPPRAKPHWIRITPGAIAKMGFW